MTRTAFAVATAVVLLAVGSACASRAAPPKNRAEVRLARDRNGVCRPSNPDPMGERHGGTVHWQVTNQDCPPQYIWMRNFSQSGRIESITDPDPVQPRPDIAIPTGETKDIQARVTKTVWFVTAHYKYEIWLGTTADNRTRLLDPDFDVWPRYH